MVHSKRICNACRANATIKEDGVTYTAIAWHCPVCTKGHCKHVASYAEGKQRVCSDCKIAAMDSRAIQRGSNEAA
jgi:hypothetical protein